MKVLFVYIDCNSLLFPPHYSVGIGSLSAILKREGHGTQLVYYREERDLAKIVHAIEAWHPEVLGFSSMSSGFPNVQRLSQVIKKQFPDLFIICGGVHPTLWPECLETSPSLDAICRGEGEMPLLRFLQKFEHDEEYTGTSSFWFRQEGRIIKNPLLPLVTDLDELPMPDRDIFNYESILQNFHGRSGEFLFCRGCPFECSYCSNHALKKLYPGQYVRYPSVERAIDELLQVTSRYQLDSVILHDDIITLNKSWFFRFFTEYSQRIGLPFACSTRVGTCNRDMITLLKEAGCRRLIIGIESGNEYIRERVLNRHISNAQIMETFVWAREEGIETHTQNMVGLPEETPSRFVDTIRLTAAVRADSPSVNIFHPYPGTRLYEICREQGLIAQEDVPADFKERSDSILHLPNFRRRDILIYNQHFRMFVQRERNVLERKFCLERILPPYPPFFRLIFWHEGVKKTLRETVLPIILRLLRGIRIHGLHLLKKSCGEKYYKQLKAAYHGIRLKK